MKFKSGIYLIVNLRNNHRYVGSSYDLPRRLSYHRTLLKRGKHDNQHLQRAYNKYGEGAFIFKVVTCCCKEDCLLYEQIFIDKLHPEYNMTKKAGNSAGYRHTPQAIEKLLNNKNASGVIPTDEWREKQRAARLGKKYPESLKEKIRQGVIRYWQGKSPEERKEIGKNNNHPKSLKGK
jgi:group I intron endonuclease